MRPSHLVLGACALTIGVGPARAYAPHFRDGAVTNPPPPDPQIVAIGSTLAGTWKCKGVRLLDDGSSTPLRVGITSHVELGGAWIATLRVAADDRSMIEDHDTYDPIAKHWTRYELASTAGHVEATSDGEVDGVWTWTGVARSSGGSNNVRDFEQRAGRTRKLWGEIMLHGAWRKTYELSCER